MPSYIHGRTLRERLFSRLIIDQATGCLLWAGSVNSKGYGSISVNGKWRKVHRLAWELEYGPIPAGLQLDHVKARGCLYRHCANTAHLELVTPRENVMRGDTLAARNAAQIRCIRGHIFDAVNTAFTVDGRVCRACVCIRQREWVQRNRARKTQPTDGAA
jgi:hypothetical protein